MALDRCLPDLERKGVLDVGRSAEARALYDQLYRSYRRSHDDAAAAALASQDTVARLRGALAHKERNLIRQRNAQAAIVAKARAFDGGDPGGSGPIDPRGVEAVFAFDPRAGHNDTIEARWKVIRGRSHAMISDVLMKHRADLLGNVRAKADLDHLLDEVYKPGTTGNANAAELAGAWTSAAEYLRARANEAGFQIGKIEGYFPHSPSARKIRAGGFDAYRNLTLDTIDRGRMIDYATGLPFTDEKLELLLRDVWETQRTDGFSKVEAGAVGGKMLANQRAEHRVLHFKDGDAWRRWHEAFGEGNAYDAMMGHIDSLARDIALTEILGPNPAATLRWLGDTLDKTAALDTSPDSRAGDKAHAGRKRLERLYNEITGANRRPESERLALTFSTIRGVQTSAKLLSATLSAVTDASFGAVTRKFNGIPATPLIMSYARQLNPASAEDRVFAIRAGLIAEEYAHMTSVAHRFLGEEMTGEVARRLSSGLLRLSGLSWLTQAGRWAFGMDVLGHLTAESGKAFDALDAPLQRAFASHGISPADWDAIRATPLEVHKGAGWILPGNIEDPKVADRLMQWILTEVDYAVPMPDLRTRATMNMVAPRGTWFGEIARSMLQFKSFGISLALMQGRRIGAMGMTGQAVSYAIGFTIATTIGGMAALQLKEVANGRDLRPLDDPDRAAELWAAAYLQGGGLGIYGDFLGNAENRYGGGFGSTLLGPAVQTGSNVADLTGGNIYKAARGDETDVGKDMVRLIRQEVPGSSLWYSRLAYNRLLADTLQEAVDPDYRDSYRRMEQRARERGQEFWWEPGETSPQRAPDMGGEE